MNQVFTPQVVTPIVVREVPVAAVRPLRHRVLRSGFPEQAVHTDRDDDPGTVHLAAFAGDEVIGVITMFPEAFPEEPGQTAARFRWMAIDAERRRSGTGTTLLRHAAAFARDAGLDLMWAHGRDTAQGFYDRLGFRVVGDGYLDEITGVSHHSVVIETAALLDG
jgi:GNAT superfamily N-acetyltransferase